MYYNVERANRELKEISKAFRRAAEVEAVTPITAGQQNSEAKPNPEHEELAAALCLECRTGDGKHKCKGFTPIPRYNLEGDFIELYWEDANTYGEAQDNNFSLMRAMDDHRIVGVKVYGIKRLTEVSAQLLNEV